MRKTHPCGRVTSHLQLASAEMAKVPFERTVVDDPAELGLDVDKVAELLARAQREVDAGHTPSCQLAIARDGLLDFPQYTRPAEFRGLGVPAVLLSGHHAEIEKWRREQALERTRRHRPDLLANGAERAAKRERSEES